MSTPTFEPDVFVDVTREQYLAWLAAGKPSTGPGALPAGAIPITAAGLNRLGQALAIASEIAGEAATAEALSSAQTLLQGAINARTTAAQAQSIAQAAIAAFVGSAPAELDTWPEVVAYLSNLAATDSSVAGQLTNLSQQIAAKLDASTAAATYAQKAAGGTDGQALVKAGSGTAWATITGGAGAGLDAAGRLALTALPRGLAARGIQPPKGVFAVPGNTTARVFFETPAVPDGTVVTITASTGQIVHALTSPATVRGLVNGTAVTFTAVASTSDGRSAASLASDPVTPSTTPGVVRYVDSMRGLDTNDGLSVDTPLKTLAAATAKTYAPGDALLLKRGSTWVNEQIGVTSAFNGVAGNPITIGAYGAGARPVIDHAQVLTDWQSYVTQGTRPEQLTNGAMETFATANGQPNVPSGWGSFVGSGGGSIDKSTTVIDTGSTASTVQTFGGGTNTIFQVTNTTAAQEYAVVVRAATDAAGVSAGANLRVRLRCGDGTDQAPYRYYDGSAWVAADTATAAVITPTTSFATTTTTVTPPYAQLEISLRNNTGSGFSVYTDNVSIKPSQVLPTSPNTYRVALTRTSGTYPGMLYRDGAYSKRALDPDRLPNNGWYYDGSFLYTRSDAGSPKTNGVSYVVPSPNVDRGVVSLYGRSHVVVRDLSVRYANLRAIEAGYTTNVTIAENYVEHVGAQTTYTGVPSATNGAISMFEGNGGWIRGNYVYECQTDLYAVEGNPTAVKVTDNVGIRGQGDFADILQAGGSNLYIARNYFDQSESPTPKGCMILGSSASTIEDNVCVGGHFGISMLGNDQIVRRNLIIGVGAAPVDELITWPGGLYSENGNVTISGVQVYDNVVIGCRNGIALTTGVRPGWDIHHNTFVGSLTADANLTVTFNTGNVTKLRDNIFASPGVTSVIAPSPSGLQQATNLPSTSDPLFIDAAGRDYRLAVGSPALGAGSSGSDIGARLTLAWRPGPGFVDTSVSPASATARLADATASIAALKTQVATLAAALSTAGDGLYAPRAIVGETYGPPAASLGTFSMGTVNRCYMQPLAVGDTSWTLSGAVVETTAAGAAGSVLRGGIWADENGRPGSLLEDWGTVDATVVGTRVWTATAVLPRGRYWIGCVAQVAAGPTVRANLGSSGANMAMTFAFPNGTLDNGIWNAWWVGGVSGALTSLTGQRGSPWTNPPRMGVRVGAVTR